MSTSTWGEPEAYADESYLLPLLKQLLKQMMTQFSAQGGCVALYDESLGRMRIRLHIRARANQGGTKQPSRRMTVRLENDTSPSGPLPIPPPSSPLPSPLPQFVPIPPLLGLTRSTSTSSQQLPHLSAEEEVDDIPHQQSELFAVGNTYPLNVDLIGRAWAKNEAYSGSYEDYLELYHNGQPLPYQTDVLPLSYLGVPIREPVLTSERHNTHRQPGAGVMGVVVLYHTTLGVNQGFQPKMRAEALQATERIALYLQNQKLRHIQQRTSAYMQGFQEISTAFPDSVNMKVLFEEAYQFAARVVNISSFLITLFDRDDKLIIDVFAVNNRRQITTLDEPITMTEADRPVWSHIIQKGMRQLQFSPSYEPEKSLMYAELLTGTWGDQRQAASFLLLPMKMFNRVTGSICCTSEHVNAYRPEEIQVLETMVQIFTVSVENEKLYRRDAKSLGEAKQREEQLIKNNARLRESQEQLTEKNAKLQQREHELAALNSALQSISATLNLNELLNTFVKTVAQLVQAEMCVFFQLAAQQEDMIAKAIYATPSQNNYNDESEIPVLAPPRRPDEHEELIEKIRVPFKNTLLEKRVQEEGFIYLYPSDLEDLALQSDEGGAIFLKETGIEQMIMIPVSYQGDLIGMLAVHTPKDARYFHPREIGMLLAICAQAASAIRNAQLFEQREEAYAELQHMDTLKDEFLVTASHELRTPLSGILGYASLLKKQSERISAKQVLRFATKIESSAQQLTDLVASMTEAAKMGVVDKKLELNHVPVHVLTTAQIAENMLSVNIEQKITLYIDPTLWIDGDKLRIRQVMTNLLDNAAKYSPGTGNIEITSDVMSLADVTALLPEDQADHGNIADHGHELVVLVRVRDEGEGIAPDDQKKIFEKFVRAPRSLTTPIRGTGLGLFICRRYIEAMNGKLWLEHSEPNEGSTFSFYLPYVEAPTQDTGEHDISEYQAT